MATNPLLNILLQRQPSPTFRTPFSQMIGQEEEVSPFAVAQQPDFATAYRELLMRQPGPATSAYKKFLEQGFPEEQQFKPGKVSRLAAALSGAATGFNNPGAAPQVVEEILSRPYRKAVERYKSEGSKLERAAALEEQQYGKDITAAREMRQLENQEADNRRADLLATSLLNQRKLSMDNIRDQIDKRGMFHEVDKSTGILYLIKPDGTKQPLGKFDESTGERLDSDKDIAKYRNTLSEGTRRRLQEDAQRHAESMERERQKGRIELVGKRGDAQIKAIQERGKIKPGESTSQRIRQNYFKVDSVVNANPQKYEDVWEVNPLTGYKDLNPDMADTPEYKELHSILYEGFGTSGAGTKQIGKYQVK